jgi:hypothetical protein
MTQEEGIAYIKQVLHQIKARRQVETARNVNAWSGVTSFYSRLAKV